MALAGGCSQFDPNCLIAELNDNNPGILAQLQRCFQLGVHGFFCKLSTLGGGEMSILRKGDISEKGRAASLKLFADRYFHLKCSYSGLMLKVWESKRVEVGKKVLQIKFNGNRSRISWREDK
jgi:hypothetical protein